MLKSVYLYGDSIPEGHPTHHGRLHRGGQELDTPNVYGQMGYAIEQKFKIAVLNQAIGSETCAQNRARWNRDVAGTATDATVTGYPTVLIIQCGINDVFASRTPSDIQQDIAWMVEQARAAGVHVVVNTIGNHGTYTSAADGRYQAAQAVNAWLLTTYGGTPGVLLARYDEFIRSRDPEKPYSIHRPLLFDAVHPNEGGHDQWGRELARVIQTWF